MVYPDVNLDELRTLVAQLVKQIDNDPNPWEGMTGDIDTDAIRRVLELFQGLDQSIGRGGLLPAAWTGRDIEHHIIKMDRKELSKLLVHNQALSNQVTNTQTSNTALVEENRRMKDAIRDLLGQRDAERAGDMPAIQNYDMRLNELRKLVA